MHGLEGAEKHPRAVNQTSGPDLRALSENPLIRALPLQHGKVYHPLQRDEHWGPSQPAEGSKQCCTCILPLFAPFLKEGLEIGDNHRCHHCTAGLQE